MKNVCSSFNRISFSAAVVALVALSNLFAQYTEATLNGPWFARNTVLDTFAVDNMGYVVFDGNGDVTDISTFNMGCSGFIGNYTVTANDSFLLDLRTSSCESLSYAGQFLSDHSATYMSGTRILWKVPHTGALRDSLAGVLNSPGCGQKSIVLCLDSEGTVTSSDGIEGVTGRVYADSGLFMGHFKTGDTSMCQGGSMGWNEFSIAGKYSNDSLKGVLYFGESDTNSGTVLLVRKGLATSLVGKVAVVEPQGITCSIVRNGIFSITMKNPVDGNLQLRVMNLSGRAVASKSVQCASGSHTVQADMGRLSRGAYIVRLQAGSYMVQNTIAIQ